MPGWIGIELMAQAIAAHFNLHGREQGRPPRIGLLLGTSAYTSSVAAYAADAVLTIFARVIYVDDIGLGAYECTISQDEQELAQATLKVFESGDPTPFREQGDR
jgi:predicted hotdog family 3-hydroxylacyl-ACP dehydratase